MPVSVISDRGICLIKLFPRLAIIDGEQAWKMRSDAHDEPQTELSLVFEVTCSIDAV